MRHSWVRDKRMRQSLMGKELENGKEERLWGEPCVVCGKGRCNREKCTLFITANIHSTSMCVGFLVYITMVISSPLIIIPSRISLNSFSPEIWVMRLICCVSRLLKSRLHSLSHWLWLDYFQALCFHLHQEKGVWFWRNIGCSGCL